MDIGFDYKLNKNSIVFDVGGYKGDFTDYIVNKYNCGVHIFEPLRSHFKIILERFKNNPLVWPYSVALEDVDCVGNICVLDNSSGLYGDSGPYESIKIRDIYKFIKSFKYDKIDLIKLNCEGSEYKILAKLQSENFIDKVSNFVIQFHDNKDKNIYIENLSKTHKINHKCDYWVWFELN